mgnify:CR=1 FL=1
MAIVSTHWDEVPLVDRNSPADYERVTEAVPSNFALHYLAERAEPVPNYRVCSAGGVQGCKTELEILRDIVKELPPPLEMEQLEDGKLCRRCHEMARRREEELVGPDKIDELRNSLEEELREEFEKRLDDVRKQVRAEKEEKIRIREEQTRQAQKNEAEVAKLQTRLKAVENKLRTQEQRDAEQKARIQELEQKLQEEKQKTSELTKEVETLRQALVAKEGYSNSNSNNQKRPRQNHHRKTGSRQSSYDKYPSFASPSSPSSPLSPQYNSYFQQTPAPAMDTLAYYTVQDAHARARYLEIQAHGHSNHPQTWAGYAYQQPGAHYPPYPSPNTPSGFDPSMPVPHYFCHTGQGG